MRDFIIGLGIICLFVAGIMLWAIKKWMPKLFWTRAERDAILAALIEQRNREKMFERMVLDWHDGEANTREDFSEHN